MLLYNLHKELCLQPPVSHDKDVKLPLCMLLAISITPDAHCCVPDPSIVLTPPKQSMMILTTSLWKMLTATLATHFDKPVSIIHKLIPKDT
jgi:hypothetical protein